MVKNFHISVEIVNHSKQTANANLFGFYYYCTIMLEVRLADAPYKMHNFLPSSRYNHIEGSTDLKTSLSNAWAVSQSLLAGITAGPPTIIAMTIMSLMGIM